MQEEHSKLSASSAHRWMNCTASYALCEDLPPQGESMYAAEGKEAHSVAETLLKGQVKEGVSLEMMAHAQMYANVVMQDLMACSEFSDLHIEDRIALKGFESFTQKKLFGTCDAWFIGDGILHLYDLKYGQGIKVYAKDNEQLLYYSIGMFQKASIPINGIKLTIVQPRLAHIDSWKVPMKEHNEFLKKMKGAIKEIESGNVHFEIGKGCTFCPAKGICPEQRRVVEKEFAVELDKPIQKKPVNLESVENFKQYLDNAYYLEKWISAVKAHAFTLLEAGAAIEGYGLEQGRLGSRQWIDPDNAREYFQKRYPIISDYLNTTLKSPTEMLKITCEKDIKDLIERKPGKLTLKKLEPIDVESFEKFDEFDI